MIEVPCYNCGSEARTLYATENGCNLVKCSNCGLLYVSPRPTDQEIAEGVTLGAHTGEKTIDSTGRYMGAKVAIYRKVLKDIYTSELQSHERTWLDVGCGHGELLVALRELSNDKVKARGIEPNRFKIEAARKRGLHVDYFDLASHKGRYDSISLLNVYSHLTDPPEFLSMIKQRLNPNGEILLETGDTADLPADINPRPFLLPDHLSFSSQKILTDMLTRSGFQIVSINKYPTFKLWIMKWRVLREVIKAFVPNKKSQLPVMYRWQKVSRYRTDTWIRARVPG